jgi:6-phosphogluconolactonase (cycloisomerase 2 family)
MLNKMIAAGRLAFSYVSLIFIAAAITACSGGSGGSGSTSATRSLTAISVTPAQSSVAAGLTQQFKATGTYSDGSTKDIGATVVWSSGTSSIATISATGLASAKAQGTSLITATSGAISGSAPFTVGAASLVSLALTPQAPSVAAGLTQQMVAVGTFSDNTSGNISNSVTWTSAPPAIATVNAAGLITTKIQGSALIQVSSGSVTGSTTLNVLPPRLVSIAVSPANATIQIGATTPQQFAVIGTFTDHSTADVTGSSTFALSNPWVASVTGTGAATPLRAGFTAVNATYTSLTSAANFTVLATPRFLYVSSDAGRDLTRMVVNPQTGQPSFLGYQKTGNYSSIGPGCFSSEPTGSFAYLSSPISSSAGVIYTYRIDGPTGQLTPWGANPLHVASPLGCIEFEPSGKFAYAAGGLDSGTEVITFSVDVNGALTQIGSVNLSNSSGGLAVDPLGKFLYVAAEDVLANGSGAAYGYFIDSATGALSPIPGTPFPLPQGAYGTFSFHPSGSYVYFANSSTTSISEFTIDRETGQLTPVASGTVDPCINPVGLMFSPDGSQAYVRCGEDNNRSVLNAPIVSFLVGSGGHLAQAGTAIAGPASWNMAVDPSGKFVYVLGSGIDVSQANGSYYVAGNSVMVYQTAVDGKIALVNQIAGRVQADGLILIGGASAVKVTPLHAYVTSSGDSKLTSYTVSADGSLVSLQSIATSASPVASSFRLLSQQRPTGAGFTLWPAHPAARSRYRSFRKFSLQCRLIDRPGL